MCAGVLPPAKCHGRFRLITYSLSLYVNLISTFANLRKATVNFVMSVFLPSARNSAPTRRIFMKFDIWRYFLKSAQKMQVLFKSDENNEYFTWRCSTFVMLLRRNLIRMKNGVKKSCRENQNAHFSSENHTICEIMWKNIIEPGSPQMTIGRMRFACQKTKARIQTHAQHISFPRQPRTLVNVTLNLGVLISS